MYVVWAVCGTLRVCSVGCVRYIICNVCADLTCKYSKISIIRRTIIRISGLIQSLMNGPFQMYGIHMWLDI